MRVYRGACEAGGAWKCSQVQCIQPWQPPKSSVHSNSQSLVVLGEHRAGQQGGQGTKSPPPPSPNIGSWRYNDKQQDLDA